MGQRKPQRQIVAELEFKQRGPGFPKAGPCWASYLGTGKLQARNIKCQKPDISNPNGLKRSQEVTKGKTVGRDDICAWTIEKGASEMTQQVEPPGKNADVLSSIPWSHMVQEYWLP